MFRERVEAADEELLAVGNLTGCETINTLKKAAADYRQKHRIDEDIFRECRIISSVYCSEDTESTIAPGKMII